MKYTSSAFSSPSRSSSRPARVWRLSSSRTGPAPSSAPEGRRSSSPLVLPRLLREARGEPDHHAGRLVAPVVSDTARDERQFPDHVDAREAGVIRNSLDILFTASPA